MPSFVCATCGREFSLSEAVLARYPGWTPRQCRPCRNGGAGAPAGGSRRPRAHREENLTLEQVLARYDAGPRSGVFTDGSADPNPGPGGWGAVYVVDGEIVDQAWGHEPQTTNNRMELRAVIAGYDLVPEGTPATIHTDSRLVHDTLVSWAAGWEKRGWTRKAGPVQNLDLVKEAYARKLARPEIKLAWVKAHDGSRWNEYADSLATAYRRATP